MHPCITAKAHVFLFVYFLGSGEKASSCVKQCVKLIEFKITHRLQLMQLCISIFLFLMLAVIRRSIYWHRLASFIKSPFQTYFDSFCIRGVGYLKPRGILQSSAFRTTGLLEGIIMSSGRGRKRAVAGGAATSVSGGVEDVKPNRRGRRAIKIEIEKEDSEEETTSKYFKKDEVKTEEGVNPVKKELKVEAAEEVGGSSSKKVQKAKASPGKNKVPVELEPPKNWEKILENIKIMRSTKTAAVDTMGCERTADLAEKLEVQRFQTLVSLMLSSQTKDPVTYAAMDRLKERGLTVQSMLDADETELGEILKPVSFYKRKATYIKKTSGILREKYNDDIPRTVDDLCALPGVGPKMAYICMNAAWHENVGIGVDTHVHRIANRLKWTGKNGTSTPEKTREALESWMPKDDWQEMNILLVGFGQETCVAIGPKCGICLNKDICPSSALPKPKKKK